MEKPSKFDRAIQDKLAQMEAEPSARVWSHVRAEVGGSSPKPQFPWLRVAAGVAVLLMASGAAYLFLRNDGTTTGGHIAETFAGKPDRNWSKPRSKVDTAKVQSPEVLEYSAPQPKRILEAPSLAKRNPVENAPQVEKPRPEDSAPKFTLEQQEPLRQIDPPVLEEIVQEPVIAQAPEEILEEPSGIKKSYRIPGRQDFALSKLRANSKNILETIAEGADSKLGIPTEYTRETTDEGEVTAFSMDLGFVKFRKVRSSK